MSITAKYDNFQVMSHEVVDTNPCLDGENGGTKELGSLTARSVKKRSEGEFVTLYTLGAVGGFRKWSCEDLKIKKYLRQNGNTGTLQAVAWV
jgi:hypothetical protein